MKARGANVIRLLRIIAWLHAVGGVAFAGFAGFRHGLTRNNGKYSKQLTARRLNPVGSTFNRFDAALSVSEAQRKKFKPLLNSGSPPVNSIRGSDVWRVTCDVFLNGEASR